MSGGVWLLEVDVRARVLRVASEAVELDGVLWRAGLGLSAASVDLERASVVVEDDGEPWSCAPVPLRGGRAVLSYVLDGRVKTVLVGEIAGAAWGAPGRRELELEIERSVGAASAMLIGPTERVSAATWPVLAGRTLPDRSIGSLYPVILGGPGSMTTPSTPAVVVDWNSATPASSRILVARGHVAAAEVRLFNVSAGEQEVRPIVLARDLLGQPVSLVSFGTLTPSEDAELWVAWPAGGGQSGPTGPIVHLGDLIAWGSTLGGRWDHARQLRASQSLARFAVGVGVNEAMPFDELVERAVLEVFPVQLREGPHGRWIELVADQADRAAAVARLATDGDDPGWIVRRSSALVESADEIANVVVVDFQPAEGGRRYARSIVVDAERDVLAARSQRLYGRRELAIAADAVSSGAVAALVARSILRRSALPSLLISYDGGLELSALSRGDVVELRDAELDTVAIVRDVELRTSSVGVMLEVMGADR